MLHDGSSSSKDIDEIIKDLSSVDAKRLDNAWNNLAESDYNRYQKWSVVRKDGVFYKDDAKDKLENNLQLDVNIILGVNSYEGSLVETFYSPEGFSKEDISLAFGWIG